MESGDTRWAAVAREDRVRQVLHRCAWAFDQREWDGLREVFAEDAIVDFGPLGGSRAGLPAITRFCRRALERFDTVQHFITNVVVTGGKDEVESRAYFLAVHVVDAAPDPFVVSGMYQDVMVETGGRLRIAHRTLTPVMQFGNAAGRSHPGDTSG